MNNLPVVIAILLLGIPLCAGLVLLALKETKRFQIAQAAIDKTRAQDHHRQLLEQYGTYYQPGFLAAFGIVFVAVGTATACMTLFPGTLGETSLYQNHRATPLVRLFWAPFSLGFLAMGSQLILDALNYRLTVTEEGLEVRDSFRRVYSWKWHEITRAKRIHAKKTAIYIVGDRWKTTRIDARQARGDLDAMFKVRFALLLED